MTLHEQYKEDTEPHPFLKNKGYVKILMKKAYLNSIDCMIDRHMKKAILPPLGGEPDYDEGEYIQSSIHIEELNYLRKQRELIANRNTKMNDIEKIRELLNVPKDQRIAQHIYNSNRDVEINYQFNAITGGNRKEHQGVGVDIFSIEDERFINKLKEK